MTTLLLEKLIDSGTLISRVSALPVDAEGIASISGWVTLIACEVE